MKTKTLIIAAFVASSTIFARAEEVKVFADKIAADNVTGALVASGHVMAVSKPVCLLSELVTKDENGKFTFSDPTSLTTCTNDLDHLHWKMTGDVTYQSNEYALIRNLWVELFDVPVLWLPIWYYPMNTDYGLRVMPGHAHRWGAFLLTKYVYHLYGDYEEGHLGLGASTRFDIREKNGVAAGQSVNWQLGDFGRGKFRVYYAWDDDYDHYDRHSTTRKWNYSNWESTVPHERYGLNITHRWEPTERDVVNAKASYYSDSRFQSDFIRNKLFTLRNEISGSDNEVYWEHLENSFSMGLSVAGPVNEFYEGTARLPEYYIDVNPMPVFSLPINYESATRIGYLDRDYAKIGKETTSTPFRYNPGPWANYNAFRADTYHRLTAPFKVADVLAVAPRTGVRGTYWSDSGYTDLVGNKRAGGAGEISRSIVEGGITFSSRGTADFDNGWSHIIEPYADILAQEANYDSLKENARPYIFDNLDASREWLDQFAGRGRNLPYSWYGVTPGLRNALRKMQDNGESRAILDFDVYCAIQLNDTDYTDGDRYHRLVRDPEDPNYGKDEPKFVPGVRVAYTPEKDTRVISRVEYDTDDDTLAYGLLRLERAENLKFKWYLDYIGRDHRWWDFSSTQYDSKQMSSEAFNWIRYQFVEAGFEYDICDPIACGPFARWDIRKNELDEIGAWIDYRTDCLGFRFTWTYQNEYERIDGSKYDDDFSCGFFIYLRALGAATGNPFED